MNANSFFTSTACGVQRIWDARAPWLLTLDVPYVYAGLFVCKSLQSRAVVDDFGTLIAVEAFR